MVGFLGGVTRHAYFGGVALTQALLTHHLDQQAAEIRDWCDRDGLDLHDPAVRRALQLCTDWILVAGKMAEPDDRCVAAAFFLMASAWRAVVS